MEKLSTCLNRFFQPANKDVKFIPKGCGNCTICTDDGKKQGMLTLLSNNHFNNGN